MPTNDIDRQRISKIKSSLSDQACGARAAGQGYVIDSMPRIGSAAALDQDECYLADPDGDGVACIEPLDRGDGLRCWYVSVAVRDRHVRVEPRRSDPDPWIGIQHGVA
ncbi:hypothetical protein [Dactylosporangium sp. CA-233914]|uniref:hypothetical protein n=1 Tax=Dactylosporangium sp. CA-233914 TaxID=3239934 RepID=UPI003D8B8D3D